MQDIDLPLIKQQSPLPNQNKTFQGSSCINELPLNIVRRQYSRDERIKERIDRNNAIGKRKND